MEIDIKRCEHCGVTVNNPCVGAEVAGCNLYLTRKARGGPEYFRHPRLSADKMDPGRNADFGRKDDDGKVPLDLLAPEFLYGTAEVLKFGAQKYEAYNWAKGMKWSRVFAALMRHMWKWWSGEKLDPETGLSHLWHASCCLMFLVAYEERGTGDDDRPT